MSAVPGARRALVLAGSRGIGRAIVERLADDGLHVTFSWSSRPEAAADLERAVGARGGTAVGRWADAAEVDTTRALIDDAAADTGGLDVLVLNAGVPPAGTTIATTALEVYDRTMAVNARGVFAALGHAATVLRPGGAIVTISSTVARSAPAGTGAYAASKAALEALTVVAARELGPRGVTVNAVSPGAVDTEAMRAFQTPDAIERIAARTPIGRIGEGADVAALVAFLAGPDSRWITGQVVRADGGLS